MELLIWKIRVLMQITRQITASFFMYHHNVLVYGTIFGKLVLVFINFYQSSYLLFSQDHNHLRFSFYCTSNFYSFFPGNDKTHFLDRQNGNNGTSLFSVI